MQMEGRHVPPRPGDRLVRPARLIPPDSMRPYHPGFPYHKGIGTQAGRMGNYEKPFFIRMKEKHHEARQAHT